MAMGTPRRSAETVADLLVKANLTGHDSHGIVYLTRYAGRIKRGIIDPKAEPEVLKETPTTALVDGHWTFGQLTAKKAMEVAIKKATTSSIGAVGTFHCNHTGRLGEYTMMATEHDMIGMLFGNGPRSPYVQPYGAASALYASNPMSAAVPAGKMKAFLLDFATSAVAEGKVALARLRGERIPLGWIVDKNGNPTDDPKDFYPSDAAKDGDRGRLLTFGATAPGQGHKGYCLSILMEILGGILTGTGAAGSVNYEEIREAQNGILVMAINVESFMPIATFKGRVDALFRRVHELPVQSGFKYDHVLIPGEPEWYAQEKRLEEGIEVEETTWQDITKLAKELGLDIEQIMK